MRRESLEALYRRWGALVYRRCRRMLRDEEAALDALQEVFARILAKLDDYEVDMETPRLLYTITTRHCLNLLRDAKATVSDVVLDRMGTATASPQGQVLARDTIQRLFGEMDERTALAGYLSFVDGLTQEEIGAALGLSRKTVGKLVRAFRQEARDREEGDP